MSEGIYKVPSNVTAVGGMVVVDGPGGVVYSMTPDAASETSARLADAARRASTQLTEMSREIKPDVASIGDIPPDSISL